MLHTFIVLEMNGLDEPEIICHVKTADDAIRVVTHMREFNPDRLFHWIPVPKVKAVPQF